MKMLSGAGVIGLVGGLVVIYWLGLVDAGAIALTLVITMSTAVAVGGMLSRRGRAGGETGSTHAS